MTEKDVVLGLDIGTRNVVGVVGYQTPNGFHVLALNSKEHDTRAMLDGQIHDIGRVGEKCRQVKAELEKELGIPLKQACIAAAGRVLRTVTTRVTMKFNEETVVTGEDLHALDMMGIDQANSELQVDENKKYKFYCVGYTTMKYYLNDEVFGSLEGHKAESIAEDLIVTFLPEDVVDGLYSAVAKADMEVANLTLEPIAAINIAIPNAFRMLNIALVDVGAGTSDICITRDGSIVAYGMIPEAGDELTEVIVQAYLVDFATAEMIKLSSTTEEEITYEDIMGITHTIKAEDVWKLTDPVMERIAKNVSSKIKELNGDKSVSAIFVVGGGGKVHGFTKTLAEEMGIVEERVALRGAEVMKNITFEGDDSVKDPLIVTPIGICLNYYEQKNNFIMIHFNGEIMKLYDNGQLTVTDAAMQAGYSAEQLFPRRGKAINFTVNGSTRMIRGSEGESAVVTKDGVACGLSEPLEFNCHINLEASTEGTAASGKLSDLPEFGNSKLEFTVNGQRVICPKFIEVNGSLEPGDYVIQEGDVIESRGFYTVGQLAQFMDMKIDPLEMIYVNNREASTESLVYENFSVDFAPREEERTNTTYEELTAPSEALQPEDAKTVEGAPHLSVITGGIHITLNGESYELTGKDDYIFVDIFNLIEFDPNEANGRSVVTTINGNKCQYADPLNDGDVVELRWA